MAAFLVVVDPAKVYLGCAIFGGSLFVLRIVLMLVGVGDSDADMPDAVDAVDMADGDADADSVDAEEGIDAGLKVLTLQGLTAFVMMFGLTGYSLNRSSSFGVVLTLLASALVGFFTLWLVAKAFMLMTSLQSSGTVTLETAVGEEGTVYLSIPVGGTGKVQVKVGGHLKVVDAVTEGQEELRTGARVYVDHTMDGRTLIVRPA